MEDTILTKATLFLQQQDDDWAQLIDVVGPCTFQPRMEREPYEALVRAVACQQLHAKAGDAIINRLIAHYNGHFPSSRQLMNAAFEDLRACGFSGRKVDTIQGIARGVNDGVVPLLLQANTLSNEALIERLIGIKGIGQWTVEMMLIFTLGRLDVLPIDDFGIRVGYKRLKHLANTPKAKELSIIGEAWQPYRSIASWYLWRVLK